MSTEVNSLTEATHDLSAVAVYLLKGVIYQEDNPELWSSLLTLHARVQDYVAVIGLELFLDESEGYAFLRSPSDVDQEEGVSSNIPRLVSRRQLSYPVSLLLALLRKKLAEFDVSGGDTRLILSRDEIIELIHIFLPTGSNEVRMIDQIDASLNKISEMGFVRRLRGQAHMIEVRRIIKAVVDAQWLTDFDQKLAEYQQYIVKPLEGSDV